MGLLQGLGLFIYSFVAETRVNKKEISWGSTNHTSPLLPLLQLIFLLVIQSLYDPGDRQEREGTAYKGLHSIFDQTSVFVVVASSPPRSIHAFLLWLCLSYSTSLSPSRFLSRCRLTKHTKRPLRTENFFSKITSSLFCSVFPSDLCKKGLKSDTRRFTYTLGWCIRRDTISWFEFLCLARVVMSALEGIRFSLSYFCTCLSWDFRDVRTRSFTTVYLSSLLLRLNINCLLNLGTNGFEKWESNHSHDLQVGTIWYTKNSLAFHPQKEIKKTHCLHVSIDGNEIYSSCGFMKWQWWGQIKRQETTEKLLGDIIYTKEKENIAFQSLLRSVHFFCSSLKIAIIHVIQSVFGCI